MEVDANLQLYLPLGVEVDAKLKWRLVLVCYGDKGQCQLVIVYGSLC